ncbi:MAG: DUF4130 domain-containing protein [Spirochaetes bacterium]|nr:DUF4130 domain-containing protein [Spirochaetota bacterium]
MNIIALPKDPDDCLHAVMLARLDGIELWDSISSLSLAAPVHIADFAIRETACRYKDRFGDFHDSYRNAKKKNMMRRHLFWASRHQKNERVSIINDVVIRSFSQGIDAVLQKADAADARFLELSNQSMREWHRMLGFIRLAPANANVLYGRIQTSFDITDALISFFKRRHPGKNIAIENNGHIYFSGDAEKIDSVEIKARGRDSLAELFDRYYDTQYIPERKNMRLLTHFIPKRYWSWIDDGKKLASHLR